MGSAQRVRTISATSLAEGILTGFVFACHLFVGSSILRDQYHVEYRQSYRRQTEEEYQHYESEGNNGVGLFEFLFVIQYI